MEILGFIIQCVIVLFWTALTLILAAILLYGVLCIIALVYEWFLQFKKYINRPS